MILKVVKNFYSAPPHVEVRTDKDEVDTSRFDYNRFYEYYDIRQNEPRDVNFRRYGHFSIEDVTVHTPKVSSGMPHTETRPLNPETWSTLQHNSYIKINFRGRLPVPVQPLQVVGDNHDPMDLDSAIVPALVRSMHNRILNLEIKMREKNGKYLRQE